MKIEFELQGVCFEWDDNKALLYIQNHSIDFEEAGEVFLDPFVKIIGSEMVESEIREKSLI